MAENIGQVKWVLDADDTRFKSKLKGASSDIKSLGNIASDIGSQLKSFFNQSAEASRTFAKGMGVAATAATAFIGYGAKIAGDLESARQGFVTILGSAEKADQTIARVKKEAAATPFELPGLIQATQALAIVNKDGNRSVDILLNVGKALAAAGKGQAELDRIIANLQQIGLTGKITEMDIRQFGMSGVNILELLAEQYGVTTAEAGEMVKESKDALGDLEKAFAKAGGAGGKFERSFIEQAGTFNQLVSNMKDSFGIFASDLIKSSGIFESLKSAIAGVINFLDTKKEVISESIVKGLEWIKNNAALVGGAIMGALVPALAAMIIGFGTILVQLSPFIILGALLAANWGKIKPVIDKVTEAFMKFWAITEPIRSFIADQFTKAWNDLKDSFQRIREVLAPYSEELKKLAFILGVVLLAPVLIAIGAFVAFIAILTGIFIVVARVIGWLSQLQAKFYEVAGAVLSAVRDNFGLLVNLFIGIPLRILAAISSFPNLLYQGGRDLISGLIRGINSASGAVVNKIKEIASNSLTAIKKFFGIQSPSKVMAGIGENIMEGMARGIAKTSSSLLSTATSVNRALASEFDSMSRDINVNGSVTNDSELSSANNGAVVNQTNNFFNADEPNMKKVNEDLRWQLGTI